MFSNVLVFVVNIVPFLVLHFLSVLAKRYNLMKLSAFDGLVH